MSALQRLSCKLVLLLAFFCATAQQLDAAEVYIVDTIKREPSRLFAEAVNRHCTVCRPAKYMDMKGSFRVGRQIVSELQSLREKKSLDLVITLGLPATRLVAQNLENTPIFYSLTNDNVHYRKPKSQIIDFVITPPVSLQLEVLTTMAAGAKQIGFLATKKTLTPIRSDAVQAAERLGIKIKFYYVNDAQGMATGLRTAIQEMDALLFVQDRMVINSDTINYILRLTLENQIPTLAYSDRLVKRGMLAALTADPEKLGEKLGRALEAYLTTGALPSQFEDPSLFQLHINGDMVEQTPMAEAKAPTGMKMVMR